MNKIALTTAACLATLLLSACNDSSGGSSSAGSGTGTGTGTGTDSGTGSSSGTGTGTGTGTGSGSGSSTGSGSGSGTDSGASDTNTSALNLRTQALSGGVIVNFATVSGATSYIVYTNTNEISAGSPSAGGSATFTCAQSPCLVTGLDNGKLLNLRVEAVSGSSQLAISTQLAVVAGAINDTGEANCISITTGSFPNGISSCNELPSGASLWPKAVYSNAVNLPSGRAPQQDGNTGRDANAQLLKIGSGKAGFDYTKLDASGTAVAASATNHECFRDNVTGLVWQSDAGNSAIDYDTTTGAGVPTSLCGLTSGWRLPTKAEAESLLQYSRTGISMDTTWFSIAPQDAWYWTSSPYPAALSGPDAGTGVQNDSLGSNFHNWVINYTTGARSTFDTNGSGAASSARTLYVNDLSSQ